MKKKTVLTVQPQTTFGFGEYQYEVETPEQEMFYFKDKKSAFDFIDFYNEYISKYPSRPRRYKKAP